MNRYFMYFLTFLALLSRFFSNFNPAGQFQYNTIKKNENFTSFKTKMFTTNFFFLQII